MENQQAKTQQTTQRSTHLQLFELLGVRVLSREQLRRVLLERRLAVLRVGERQFPQLLLQRPLLLLQRDALANLGLQDVRA